MLTPVEQFAALAAEPLVVPASTDEGDERTVTYEPWCDGYAVGFRCVRSDGAVTYVYLNPSDNEDGSDVPNVFVYDGAQGDPSRDGASIHVVQNFPE